MTAAATHWHFRANTKRRLTTALRCIVVERNLRLGHLDTFARVYTVTPDFLDTLDRPSALRALNGLHRRVRRLADDLNQAIAENPNPPTLDRVVDQILAESPPPPSPTISTLGELHSITGQALDSKYADHPLNCPDCNRLRLDPTTRGSIIFSVSCPPCVADQWPRRFTRPLHPPPC